MLGPVFRFCAAVCVALGAAGAGAAAADQAQRAPYLVALGQTRVLGLSLETMNSGIVRDAARQGFELSGGGMVDLARWYSPTRPNLTAIFATDLGPDLALIWGGSTGESGAKYSLGPSRVLGLAIHRPLGRAAQLDLELVGYFGGALSESACLGDYGAIGGTQYVNCRLAASYLPPAETLPLLWNFPPTTEVTLKVTYRLQF
jgi:hypothetical protein